MMKSISSLQVGEHFDGHVLLKNVSKGTTKNGDLFLTIALGDKTGEIESKVWDQVDAFLENVHVGNILHVMGNVTEFRGKKQLNSSSIRLADDSSINMADFIESAPVDGESLFSRIKDSITSISNESIKKITLAILEKYEEKLKTFPAARSNHHAYLSGLAYHTSSMMNVGEALCKLYPILNKDLLMAGIALHDIGKIREYTGVIGTDSTLEGRLIGHIPIMSSEIETTAKELGVEGEEVLLLQHMVLSHHGKMEWGSPVVPLIAEAEVLHMIDMIDASMDTLKKGLKDLEPGSFSNRMFSMGNRSFYKPTI